MTTRRMKAILILIVLTFYVCPLLTSAMMQSATINVPAGGDLQAHINSARTGDTLQLTDSVYVGNFIDNKGLTILGPATLRTPNADPAIYYPPKTPPAALKNLRIRTTSGQQVFNIVKYGSEGVEQDTLDEVPQGLTLDNVDIAGLPDQEVQRGIAANGANFTLINSSIREIHGRGYDTQAVCAWNGPGPFTILDNYLEGSGENVMFGGSPASIPNLVPSNITFKWNRVAKPLSWYVNDPSYAGIHWSVKNLFELKNARNVLIEGNVFEGNWTDAQAGRSILFTPRPSDSGSWAVIEDVVFQNNIVRNVGSGIHVLGHDEAPAPTETRLRRVKIANNLLHIDGARFGSNGVFLTIVAGTEDVTVEHNTVIQTGNIITTDYDPNTRFIYRDNLTRHNEYGIIGSGFGIGNPSITQYFPDGIITGNIIAKEVDSPSSAETMYPAGNFFPANLNEVGFVDLVNGNYRLASSSPYKGQASDGSDPGADIDKLNAALNVTTEAAPTPTIEASPSPSPSPSATVEPLPTVTPTPTPSPSATPIVIVTRIVAWPNAKSKQDVILEAQWGERFRLKRNLSGQFAEFEFVP